MGGKGGGNEQAITLTELIPVRETLPQRGRYHVKLQISGAGQKLRMIFDESGESILFKPGTENRI